jgi:hypothetical protein
VKRGCCTQCCGYQDLARLFTNCDHRGSPGLVAGSVTRQSWLSHRQPKSAKAKTWTVQKEKIGKRLSTRFVTPLPRGVMIVNWTNRFWRQSLPRLSIIQWALNNPSSRLPMRPDTLKASDGDVSKCARDEYVLSAKVKSSPTVKERIESAKVKTCRQITMTQRRHCTLVGGKERRVEPPETTPVSLQLVYCTCTSGIILHERNKS